jgi:hypothetical protein
VTETVPSLNGLAIIYKYLDIRQDMVVLKWTDQSCSTTFELQGYTLGADDLNLELVHPDAIFRMNDSNSTVIPSVNFTTSEGPLHYRLVALSDDLVTCSHQETKTTFLCKLCIWDWKRG